MLGRSKSKAPTLGDTVSEAAENVRDWAEHVWQDSADRAAPVVDAASKALSDAAHKVGDAASTFQHKVQDDYLPAAAGQLAPVAAGSAKAIKDTELPEFVNDAITRVTGDKKSGRRLQKAAQQWAKDADRLRKSRRRNPVAACWYLVSPLPPLAQPTPYGVCPSRSRIRGPLRLLSH